MKTIFTAFMTVFLFSAHSAADKAQLVEEFLKDPMLAGSPLSGIIEDGIRKVTESDGRLTDEKNPRLHLDAVKKIHDLIDKAALAKLQRDLWDKNLTENDLKYLVDLSRSALGKKWPPLIDSIEDQIKSEVERQVKAVYQNATGQKYTEAPKPKVPSFQVVAAPNWATKLVWRFYPDQQVVCE